MGFDDRPVGSRRGERIAAMLSIACLLVAVIVTAERQDAAGAEASSSRVRVPLAADSGDAVPLPSFGEGPSAAEVPAGAAQVAAPEPTPRVPIEIGRMQIPKLGVDETLYQGIEQWTIDLGPSYWPGTSLPGMAGNSVIAGHRSTYTRPFRDLDKLQPGDEIRFSTEAMGDAVYRVTESFVVEPKDVWIVNPTGEDVVTLFTCHPYGSERYRLVVRGALVPAVNARTVGERPAKQEATPAPTARPSGGLRLPIP